MQLLPTCVTNNCLVVEQYHAGAAVGACVADVAQRGYGVAVVDELTACDGEVAGYGYLPVDIERGLGL